MFELFRTTQKKKQGNGSPALCMNSSGLCVAAQSFSLVCEALIDRQLGLKVL